MTPSPEQNNAVSPYGADRLSALLREVEQALHETTPLGQAIQERDHWQHMWQTKTEDILKNLQQIRDELRRLNNNLDRAFETGTKDTETMFERLEQGFADERKAIQKAIHAALRQEQPWYRRIFS